MSLLVTLTDFFLLNKRRTICKPLAPISVFSCCMSNELIQPDHTKYSLCILGPYSAIQQE